MDPAYVKQDRQCTYNGTLRCVRAAVFAVEKVIISTYSEFMSMASGIQYALCMRRIVTCGPSGSKHFSKLSHKRHNFRKIFIGHKMCTLNFCTNFGLNISYFKKKLTEILLILYIGIHVKYRLFLSGFNGT
jgi:hypothetical protein